MRSQFSLFGLVAVLACSLLSACVTTPTGGHELTPAGKVLLQETAKIATRDYLRDKPDVSARVSTIRAVAVKLQAATSITTLAELRAIAVGEINKRIGDPFDREDAISLLNIFDAVLQEQVGTGKLDSQALVKVNDVINLIVASLPPS